VLLLLLGAWWICGRWFMKNALAPLSELQSSLAQLAAGDNAVRFPRSPHKELRAIVTALEDTTRALQKREQRLVHLANNDQLTGLPNRHRLVTDLNAELTRCATEGARSALFFIDLDQFKYVNDTCGHASGDHMLQLAAQQLRYAIRPNDLLARFGGDEFVVLARDVSRTEAKALAGRVLELMRGSICSAASASRYFTATARARTRSSHKPTSHAKARRRTAAIASRSTAPPASRASRSRKTSCS
jgi:diguanylate cyclase (GGDEF)-like protein